MPHSPLEEPPSRRAVQFRPRDIARRCRAILGRNTPQLILVIVVAAAVGLGATMDHLAYRQHLVEQRTLVQAETSSLAARIVGAWTTDATLLEGMGELIKHDPGMTQRQFDRSADKLVNDMPGTREIISAPGLVVRHAYPEAVANSVIGLDFHSSLPQSGAALRALETGRTVVTGPTRLIQGDPGFVISAPVMSRDGTTGRSTVQGVVLAEIDAADFLGKVGLSDASLPIAVTIRQRGAQASPGDLILGDPNIIDRHPVVTTIDLPFGSWELAAMPAGGWATQPKSAWLFRGLYATAVALLLAVIQYINVLRKRQKRAEQRLSEAIEALDDGFVLFDPADRLLTCNQRYRQMYAANADLLRPGTRFETLIRHGMKRGLYPKANASSDEWLRGRLASRRKAVAASERQYGDGRWVKVTDRRTPSGNTIGLRVDITEFKTAIEAAEAANVAKSEFLNVLSHELRTPLTVILGNSRVLSHYDALPQVRTLLADLETPEGRERATEGVRVTLASLGRLAGKVEASSAHLLHLINEMLDFSKIEAGKMSLDLEIVDLRPMIDDVLGGFKADAARRGVSLIGAVDPVRVSADPVRLTQILINLVGNAMKFTDAGEIRVSGEAQGDRVEIAVEDTGCGIAEEHLETIFDRFQQVDASSTRKAGGTGLGLAITKRLVELHGGRLRVTSAPTLGSRFSFTMPVQVEEISDPITVDS